jgi:hypothetical protein
MCLATDNPGFRVSDHANQSAKDVIVGSVQRFGPVAAQVMAFDRELDPNLGFGSFAFPIR